MDQLPTCEVLTGPRDQVHGAQAPWPYSQIDIPRLHLSGWRPLPVCEFVFKIHQRCNLACDYCYVYTMADQTWRDRPIVMAEPIWCAAAARIAEHVAAHGLSEVQIIFHGGEPLLAGIATIASVVRAVRGALPATTNAQLAIQTNGVLLDLLTLRDLRDLKIRIGVSLDGPRADHDRRRSHPDGRGSFSEVDRALRLLGRTRYRHLFSGILTTIDPRTDPVACYEWLLEYEPPAIDFLLPHANWSTCPAGATPGHPFGDWLVALFDRWYDTLRRETQINLFQEIIHAALGGASRSEAVGIGRAATAVIETDGSVEQVDSLKSSYHGAASTGFSVLDDAFSFDALLSHPGFVARQLGIEALSDQCRQCTIHTMCGGGNYAHRYRAGEGFRNPSVYCADLARIITHIQRRVRSDIEARLLAAE